VLKGGSDAESSNRAIVQLIENVLTHEGLNPRLVTLLPADREATTALLHARGWVDLIIPRGSSNLINFVRSEATIPVIETGAGVCHTYVDATANNDYARSIVVNAKTRRVSVCNALDCLLIHRQKLVALPEICAPMVDHRVIIYADAPAFEALSGHYPAKLLEHMPEDAYGTEYLDYKMSIRTVESIDDAIAHIAHYGSGHSECIVSEDEGNIRRFQSLVDAACVYVNAPTSFTDGAQFGLGAEIGISTQKLHARGPMALEEICTYKWLIRGEGQVRA
jgi:glutamate-5-semialdehyde dehydrogenase